MEMSAAEQGQDGSEVNNQEEKVEEGPSQGQREENRNAADQDGGDTDGNPIEATERIKEDVVKNNEKDDGGVNEEEPKVPENTVEAEKPSELEEQNQSEAKQAVVQTEGGKESDNPVVISEPDQNITTQEANAQTEGPESASPEKDDSRLAESQSVYGSEAPPLVAPPTSQAERPTDSETPAESTREQLDSVGLAKDNSFANGKLKCCFNNAP